VGSKSGRLRRSIMCCNTSTVLDAWHTRVAEELEWIRQSHPRHEAPLPRFLIPRLAVITSFPCPHLVGLGRPPRYDPRYMQIRSAFAHLCSSRQSEPSVAAESSPADIAACPPHLSKGHAHSPAAANTAWSRPTMRTLAGSRPKASRGWCGPSSR